MSTEFQLEPVRAIGEVFEAINRVKAGAPAFSTNFFPVEAKLRTWITNGDLFTCASGDCWGLFRQDRSLFHLFYCAGSPTALAKALQQWPVFELHKVVTDIIGPEAALAPILEIFHGQRWNSYQKLVRLNRLSQGTVATSEPDSGISFAGASEAPEILQLIEQNFDHYADQLPTPAEVMEAIACGQILTAKVDNRIGALLYFESQGFSSTVRYWVVGERYRDQKLGSALIRQYFASQSSVKRFTLWVNSRNENAITKYAHYGYTPDKLVDYVLVNPATLNEIATRNP